ncbi:NrdH-redoxin (plasmid) [Rhodococcus sp. H-CA8f]|uniref:glutaredoxin domain-containing protein n=1 Tax=Rhodococcus sp. H-CA8f TaxID=1727214 RepID=UPI000BE4425B|nr:glutaredoxin domain-containing protein [Rhodococcus sp. H-CA8f]ATI36350.1 NrdH-redoxin [Rhodococcus sp. H-CA8f]
MNTITIYSTPSCTKCNATKKKFDALGLEYQEVMLEDAPEALARFKEMGYSTAPVVVAGEDIWCDFRLDRINALGKAMKESELSAVG